jgi:hypothetical protein
MHQAITVVPWWYMTEVVCDPASFRFLCLDVMTSNNSLLIVSCLEPAKSGPWGGNAQRGATKDGLHKHSKATTCVCKLYQCSYNRNCDTSATKCLRYATGVVSNCYRKWLLCQRALPFTERRNWVNAVKIFTNQWRGVGYHKREEFLDWLRESRKTMFIGFDPVKWRVVYLVIFHCFDLLKRLECIYIIYYLHYNYTTMI